MRKSILFLSTVALLVLVSSCKKDDKAFDATGVFEMTEVVVSAESQGRILNLDFSEGDNVTEGQELGAINAIQLTMQKDQLVASQKVNTTRKLDVPSQVTSLQRSVDTQREKIATQQKEIDVQQRQIDVQQKQIDAQRGQIDVQRQQLANLQSERARFAALLADKACTEKQLADIDYQISVQQKQIAAAEKQVSAAEKQLEVAVKQLEVSRAQVAVLGTQMGVTEGQITEKRDQLTTSNNTLDSQNDVLTTQIGSVDERISDAIVRSPITGTILQKYAEKGEYAVPGKALFKVGNINDMKIRAYVTGAQLTKLKIGQKVKVYADMGEADRKEYAGTITWISSEAEFTPKTIQTREERANLVYAIKISVKNDGLIKSGMYGEVRF